jgi:hypothetical protein
MARWCEEKIKVAARSLLARKSLGKKSLAKAPF